MAEKTLEELKVWFENAEEATYEHRQRCERDADYYDGNQWTDEEMAELNKRGQPVVVLNRIKPKVDYIVGFERETRSVPVAQPRMPNVEQSTKAASIATDCLRYVCDNNDWDDERSEFFEDLIKNGTGGINVRLSPKVDDLGFIDSMAYSAAPYEREPEIAVEWVPWDRCFWDPRSRYHDFSDARYFGTAIWSDLEDAKEDWSDFKGAAQLLEDSTNVEIDATLDDTFGDRPHYTVWQESKDSRKRVRIICMWYTMGSKWMYAVFCHAGFLQSPTESPYRDKDGRSYPGLFLQSAHVGKENERFGFIRNLVSPQDEINKRRSKSLHLLQMRQIVMEKGAVDDTQRTREEAARPDGLLEVAPNKRFELLDNLELTSAHVNLMQEAKAEIDNIGVNSAMTGRQEGSRTSAKAMQTRQRGGIVELRKIMDRKRHLERRVYRFIWMLIQQNWKAERYMRVRDDTNGLQFVGINVPVTAAEVLGRQGVQIPDARMLPPEMVQQLNENVMVDNQPAEIDVDIVIDEAPDVTVVQQEQFAMLADLARAGVPIPPDVLILMSDLRNKRELADRIRNGGATPEQAAAQQQAQQQAQQLQMADVQLSLQQKQADIAKTKADTVKTMASTEESLADAQATMSSIDTDRLKLLVDSQKQGGREG